MTLPKALQDREYQKFDVDDDGNVILRTSATGTFSPNGLKNGGSIKSVELTNTEWRKIIDTPDVLASANAINIQNESTERVKIRYDDPGSGFIGMTIFANGGERQYAIQAGFITLWGKSESSTINVTVEQIA